MKRMLLCAGLLAAGLTAKAQVVTTYAGTEQAGVGTTGGAVSTAKFTSPYGVAFDSQGYLWITDQQNNLVVAIDTANSKYYHRSGDVSGGYRDAAGAGLSGSLYYYPAGIAIGAGDTVFIADQLNNSIRRLQPLSSLGQAQSAVTIAGAMPDPNDKSKTGEAGYTNGTGGTARFEEPSGIAISPDNSYMLVADRANQVIRRVELQGADYGKVSLFAGQPSVQGSDDGDMTTAASFSNPESVIFDENGDVYVTDGAGGIRFIDVSAKTVSTIIETNDVPEGPKGGLAIRGNELYIASGCRIILYDIAKGTYSDFAGSGHPDSCSFVNETGLKARFNMISSLTLSPDKNYLLVADQMNNMIRKVTLTPLVSSVNENSLESQFSIYPNPASSHILINSSLNSRASVVLMDMAGREVMSRQVQMQPGAPVRLDLQENMSGVYMLRIMTQGQVLNKKIVVE